MIEILMALFLGIVEGLTEFIPVSSTAHLILLVEGLKMPAPPGHVFEVFIQIGAIMAVVVLYFKRFWHTAITLHKDPVSQHFALSLIVGCIPAVIAGLFLHDYIKSALYNPVVIGVALIVGGIVILLLDKRLKTEKFATVDSIPLKTAFFIGCFQAIALIPGVSRSGATIMGALGLGVARPAAAEFSFFLAVPIMTLAVGYDLYKNMDAVTAAGDWGIMLAGLVAAFLTAMVVIRTVLAFIKNYGFTPFAWYRIVLGVIVLALMAGGGA